MKDFIKKIGKGPRLAKDLTHDEACEAFGLILDGKADKAQVGAFLIAQRIKGETAEEMAGMTEAARTRSVLMNDKIDGLVELAPAHDGKTKSLVLSPFVAMMLAKLNVPTLVTGGKDDVPTKKGVTPGQIFSAMAWINTTNTMETVVKNLKEKKYAYWDVADYCPKTEALKTLRDSLGLRTAINSVEKILNPCHAEFIFTGVYHGPYLKSLAEACRLVGYKNVMVWQSTEASTDLPLTKRALYRSLQNGVMSEQLEIDPATVDLKRDSSPSFFDTPQSAESAEEEPLFGRDKAILANVSLVSEALAKKAGLVYDALVYNVGAILWFIGRANSLAAGVALAREVDLKI